jgi:DNA-binding transcriptional regulator YiaG
MSTRSLSRERLERLARAPATDRAPSAGGAPASYALRPDGRELPNAIEVARRLVRCGASVRAAHAAISALAGLLAQPVGARDRVAVSLPDVADPAAFEADMAALGVDAERRRAPEQVDVASIRARMGLTREQFAARFGLDPRTLEGWEQGRHKPDAASRILLAVIERDPAAVEAVLAA